MNVPLGAVLPLLAAGRKGYFLGRCCPDTQNRKHALRRGSGTPSRSTCARHEALWPAPPRRQRRLCRQDGEGPPGPAAGKRSGVSQQRSSGIWQPLDLGATGQPHRACSPGPRRAKQSPVPGGAGQSRPKKALMEPHSHREAAVRRVAQPNSGRSGTRHGQRDAVPRGWTAVERRPWCLAYASYGKPPRGALRYLAAVRRASDRVITTTTVIGSLPEAVVYRALRPDNATWVSE